MKYNKGIINVAIATSLIAIFLISLFSPSVSAEVPYRIIEDSVVVDTSKGSIIVTPHTLTASGWVEVEFQSSSFVGDIDIALGFNGIDQVQTTTANSYGEYQDTKYRQVETIEEAYFEPAEVLNIKSTSKDKAEATIGDPGLNPLLAIVLYIDELGEQQSSIIAYESFDGKKFKYKARGFVSEPYVEDEVGWHKSNMKSSSFYYKDANKWQSANFTQQVSKDTWYKARFWIDLPIRYRDNPLEGKYNILIKPSVLSIEEAVSSSEYIFLDPWYNSSWNYRKSFSLSHAAGALTDYQVVVKTYFGAGADGTEVVEGITAGKAYLDSFSQTDFDDIRFTTSDGSTLLDFWREQYTDSTSAVFWVECDSIGVAATTFYVYWGNAAATYPTAATTTAQGRDTFIVFEDFELGVNGNDLDGDIWTFGHDIAIYSNTQDIGDVAGYYGSLSGRMEDDGTGDGRANFTTTASDNIAMRFSAYKTDAASLRFHHGNGNEYVYLFLQSDEDIEYYDGVLNDTEDNCLADDWGIVELSDFQWDVVGDTGTYDIWYDGVQAHDDASTNNSAGYDNIFWFQEQVAGASIYFDNIIVRNFSTTEPAWGTWGSEEEYAAIFVDTGICSGFGKTWAVVNGSIEFQDTVTVNEVGFDYGLTDGYGDDVTTAISYTTDTSFDEYISGLSAATTYHYRAKARVGVDWYYGSDAMFATAGSASIYEYLSSGQDCDSDNISASTWGYKQFTVGDASHTVTRINLYLKRVGEPGTATVSIRHATAGVPTGDDLVSTTFDGDVLTTDYQMYGFEVSETSLEEGTQYAIILRAVAGDAANYILWGVDCGGGLADAVYGNSTNGGLSFSDDSPKDALFEIWGYPCLRIESAKVFTSYKEADDWLIVADVNNIYIPYYPDSDVQLYFQLQFIGDDVIKGAINFKVWERQPLAIYFNAATAATMSWGDDIYKVRIQALFDENVYTEYVLVADDWNAGSLLLLDGYVRTLASTYEAYYNTAYLTSVAGQSDRVLNEAGSIMFMRGISGLELVRPNLFYTSFGIDKPSATSHTLLAPDTEEALGADVSNRIAEVSALLGIDNPTVLGWILVAIALFVGFGCVGAGHGIAGIIIALFFGGGAGLVFGGIPVMIIGAIGFVFIILIAMWIAKIILPTS